MKIGMLTGIWYIAEEASVIESLRRAATLGFRFVDLHGVFHCGPAHLDQNARLAVKHEMETLGLIPRNYVLHALKNPAAASAAEQSQNLEYLREGINLALSWGINQIMLNAGQWTYGLQRSEAWKRSVRFLQEICDYAAPLGIFIAQEPEPFVWFLVNDLCSAERMIADVNRPNFTLLVDLGHMILSRESPADLYRVKDHIIHAHLSDHLLNQHTNQVIGTGVTPFPDYLTYLDNMHIDQLMGRFGYEDLVVSFELGIPGDRIKDPDCWVSRSLEYVQQIAPTMTLY
jgi:sugar phosphate isomerase/epimerase